MPRAPVAPGILAGSFRFHGVVFCLFAAVSALLYGWTLDFPLVFDDRMYLTGNPLVKETRNFGFPGDFLSFATYSERIGLHRDLSTNFILRPVTYFTFHLNYLLDGMNPRGFRLVNVAIHTGNAFLLWLVLFHLPRVLPRPASLPPGSARFIAATASLLFLVHPLQIESVTYVIQRFTSLATLFYLLTAFAHFRSHALGERPGGWRWRAASLMALVLGMLSKENVFTAPFVLVLLDWLVLGTPWKAAFYRARLHFLCLPLLPALIILTAWVQNGMDFSLHAATHIAAHTKPASYQYHYALTEFRVVLEYLKLLLVPVGLNLDPDFPLSTSARDPRVVLAVLGIAGILALAWRWWRKTPDDPRAALTLGSVLWYFMTLGVDSSVVPLPDVMAEHRAYLPSVGALTALVCVVDCGRTRLARRPIQQWGILALMLAWTGTLSMATWARNEVWRSEVGLWKDTVAKSPNKARAWYNLACAYLRENKIHEVVLCMGQAVTLDPYHTEASIDLTTGLFVLGRYEDSIKAAQFGLKHSDSTRFYYHLGASLSNLGRIEQGTETLKLVPKGDPNYAHAQSALGINYARMRRYEQALDHFRKAASLQPLTPDLQKIFNQIEAHVKHFPRVP